MLFGYEKHLVENNKSLDTIESYTKTINQFFTYVDSIKKVKPELHEINPRDIKGFLDYKLKVGKNSVSTINKHLTILSGFFDYLWQSNKIPVDPAAKIKRYSDSTQRVKTLEYESLLDVKEKVLNNTNYSNLRKAIFILAMKGFRAQQFQIKKSNIKETPTNIITIKLESHEVELSKEDSEHFIAYLYDSYFNTSDFLFITKKKGEKYVPIELMSIYTHLNAISKDYGFKEKLNLNDMRHAYVFYLRNKEQYSIDKISNTFGINYESAAQLLKSTINLYETG
ncbi:tyrosine-type recombinase/integrase (plasmid) [Metabacillus halosaccharovorans]|uniref:tyrosine-type recombinase/integrase n=1 Tax=Metabacillus halosaccharovorans TaxID=930124 RepID=UPI0020420F6E|nr:site-specific integrase [Metabacillus halosaccharovorans]MCM3441363.1 site-specific integrase [Metabacillus halosaccharovorans]